jgi:hypothetical protein
MRAPVLTGVGFDLRDGCEPMSDGLWAASKFLDGAQIIESTDLGKFAGKVPS